MEYLLTTHLWLANLLIPATLIVTISWQLSHRRPEKLNSPIFRWASIVELICATLLPLLGVYMLVIQSVWLKFPRFHLKLALALVVVGLVHMSQARIRKYRSGDSKANAITIMRWLIIGGTLGVYLLGRLLSTKAGF